MNETKADTEADPDTESTQQPRSWLERLSHAFSREPQDRDELIELLREAERNDVITADLLGMIEGVLQVTKMQVRDIMIPRSQMVIIEANASTKKILATVIKSKHSRFPVIGDDRNKVIGILLAKDLLEIDLTTDNKDIDIKQLLRPAEFVPESKRLDVLLKECRNKHNHMAIVVDEYGGVAGLVTIEDVLEQIVGDIEDETDIDDEGDMIKEHSDGCYIIKAHTTIEDFNEFFKTEYSDEDFDTIGGLITHAFGRLPARGDQINYGDFEFKVLHADNRRIRLLQATKQND